MKTNKIYELYVKGLKLNYDGKLSTRVIFDYIKGFTYSSDVTNVIIADKEKQCALLLIKKKKGYVKVNIDYSDITKVKQHKWTHSVSQNKQLNYVKTRINNKYVWLARFVMDTECSIKMINDNMLDCRKANLKLIENTKVKKEQDNNLVCCPINEKNGSGFTNVYIHKRAKSATVVFKYKGAEIYLSESSLDFEDGVRGAVREVLKRKRNYVKETFGECNWTIEDCEHMLNKLPLDKVI